MGKTFDKNKLLKQFYREYDLLIASLKNFQSELDLIKDRVTRLELLDTMIQECDRP